MRCWTFKNILLFHTVDVGIPCFLLVESASFRLLMVKGLTLDVVRRGLVLPFPLSKALKKYTNVFLMNSCSWPSYYTVSRATPATVEYQPRGN
jgi:hypothetical protein